MSNYHLRDRHLSLKAKGLLSYMLSLPEDWDYSIAGLISQCKENRTSIRNTLKELSEKNYLYIEKLYPNETTSKRFEYVYRIFETPDLNPYTKEQDDGNQCVGNQGVENLYVENPLQLNTKQQNTDRQNTDIKSLSKDKGQKPKIKEKTLVSQNEIQDSTDLSLKQEETIHTVVGLPCKEVNGKLRVVDENGKISGGNPYSERAYQLWEDIMGTPLKRSQWNTMAGYNMLRAKDKGEQWFREMLVLLLACKKDSKSDYRARNIANLSDLQKNYEYLIDWGRKHYEDQQKDSDNVLEFF